MMSTSPTKKKVKKVAGLKLTATKKKPKASKKRKKKALKPVEVLICEREGCEKKLDKRKYQNKFCSKACKNIVEKSKYKEDYGIHGTKLRKYLKKCEEGSKRELVPTKGGFIVINNADLPTQEGYAEFIGIYLSSLHNWRKRYPEFAEALKELKLHQKKFLINNGLSGNYSPSIAKRILANNHNITEKTDHEHSHSMLGVVKHLYSKAGDIEKELRESNKVIEHGEDTI